MANKYSYTGKKNKMQSSPSDNPLEQGQYQSQVNPFKDPNVFQSTNPFNSGKVSSSPGDIVEPPKPAVPVGNHISFNNDGTVTVNGRLLSKDEYRGFLSSQGSEQSGGKVTTATEAVVADRQARDQQIMSGVTPMTPQQIAAQQQMLNVGNVQVPGQTAGDKVIDYAGAGAGAIGGAIGGIKAGATIGLIGGPAGVTAGSFIGAVGGALFGAGAAMTLDARQETKQGYKNFNLGKAGINEAIALANEGRSVEATNAFRVAKKNILISQAQLKDKTKGAIGRELSGAMDEYSAVTYYVDNQMSNEEVSFILALNNPNPAKAQLIRQSNLNQYNSEQQ